MINHIRCYLSVPTDFVAAGCCNFLVVRKSIGYPTYREHVGWTLRIRNRRTTQPTNTLYTRQPTASHKIRRRIIAINLLYLLRWKWFLAWITSGLKDWLCGYVTTTLPVTLLTTNQPTNLPTKFTFFMQYNSMNEDIIILLLFQSAILIRPGDLFSGGL